jgi:hypothetical protein
MTATAAIVAWVLLLALPSGAAAQRVTTDPRSIVLLRRDCRSDIGRHEVTLFANGTVRLREGLPQDPKMTLAELNPEELRAFRARLDGEDLSEVEERAPGGVDGAWVESCVLELLRAEQTRRFRYGRYESLPLNLSRVLTVADDIAAKVDPRAGAQHLPAGYVPRTGDVLRRVDGELFEVMGQTADKQGVELAGVQVPLTLYVPKSELSKEFVALESRRLPN